MPRGFKIADAYVEITADKDRLNQDVGRLPGEMRAQGDKAGAAFGDAFGKGLAAKVEQASQRLARARLAEQKAADAVTLSEKRLNEAREKGNVEGSRMLALEQRLSQSKAALSIAQDNTAKSTDRLADAQRRLSTEVENLGKNAGPAADRSGRDVGDKLSQGIHLAIIRNSPIIAAAVGAALAAGAPVAIAAATTLFAGIGAVAAAQTVAVRSAWSDLWKNISASTTQDAAALVPVFVNMADKIGASFDRLRPQIRDAFEASAPIIDRFTDSLLRAGENAMPGLVRAVEASGPAFDGLGSLVERIGTGLSEFFTAVSQHGGAAGETFDAIGRIVGALLPILGEFLGQGVELASVVLPPLASVLEVVAGVLQDLGPILPVVAAGFGAFKIVQSLTGPLGTFTDKIKDLAGKGLSGMASSAADAVTPINVLATTLGLAAVGFAEAERATDDFAQALLEGGAAAVQARAQIDAVISEAPGAGGSIFDAVLTGINNTNLGLALTTQSAVNASSAYDELINSMAPLPKHQALAAQAQNDLNFALDNNDAAGAAEALGRYEAETAAAEATQSQLELAIHGVTSAMIEQANQALAAGNSSLAFRQAQLQAKDAQDQLAAAIRDYGAGSREAEAASLGLESALLSQAQAAGQAAQDASGLGDSLEGQQVAAQASYAELVKLRDEMGSNFPPALQQVIAGMEASGAATGGMSASAVIAQGTVEGLRKGMEGLGMQHPRPTLDADAGPAQNAINAVFGRITELGAQHPTPVLDANQGPAQGAIAAVFGRIGELAAQRPTPPLNANPGPAQGAIAAVMGNIGALAAQRPTPPLNANPGPAQGAIASVMGSIATLAAQRPTPTASVNDRATGPLQGILGWINSLYSKTVTITTVQKTLIQKAGLAGGGSVDEVQKAIGAASGRVVGPGGPLDDLVPAIGPTGAPWRLSNGEWVIQEWAVEQLERKFGNGVMQLINSGRLPVVSVTAAATGGPVGPVPEVEYGSVSQAEWDRLLAAGWKGVAGDNREALYPPGSTRAEDGSVVGPGFYGSSSTPSHAGMVQAEDGSWVPSSFYSGGGGSHAGMVQAEDGSWVPSSFYSGGSHPGMVQAEDGSWVPLSFYGGGDPNAGRAGYVQAEDGSWVPASFYSASRPGMVQAEDGSWVPSSFYNAPSAAPAPVSGPRTSFSINSLVLQMPGAYNLGRNADKRRLLVEIRDGLQRLDREIN